MNAIHELLAPHPGRFEFALRLAVVCTATAVLVELYQTPDPALTIYLAFFLVKPDRTSSVLNSIVLVVLISVVIASVILLSVFFIDRPPWRVALMGGLSLGFLFLGATTKLKPIAPIVALVTVYALALLGQARIGELATRGLLYAWLFVAIPAVACIVVNLVGGPGPQALLQRRLARHLDALAATLRTPTADRRRALVIQRRSLGSDLKALLRVAAKEKLVPASELQSLSGSVDRIQALTLFISWSLDTASAGLPGAVRAALADTFEAMARIFGRGGRPVEVEPVVSGSVALSPLAALALQEINRQLTAFGAVTGSSTQATEPASRFFVADAFSNPDYMRYAVKATVAAMGCYLLYSLLDWPGIHTCLITCYIVSLGTTAETVEKLALRIAGCLVGAALGVTTLVFVVPHLTSIGSLSMTVFAGGLLGAWVAAGDARIAYAGFQIAFAFFLCVVQGPSPAFDLSVARDRIVGILVGDVAVYLVFTRISPISVSRRIETSLRQLARAVGRLASALTFADLARELEQLDPAQAAMQRDLQLLRYESTSRLVSTAALARHRYLRRKLEALEAPLWLARSNACRMDDVVERLNDVADAPASAASVTHHLTQEELVSSTALGAHVDRGLRAVERAARRLRRENVTC